MAENTPAQTSVNIVSTNIWSSSDAFNVAARMAKALSESTIVPKAYQGNAGNCIIAIEMANRLNTSPMMVMQNLYIVNGNPSWSSQYIIAMINNSKRYQTELQFDMSGSGDALACTAFAIAHDGRKVEGPKITMELAKKEGWIGKNGSKWKTMPEVMIRYRAASFFGRINCPDLVMGLYSTDEVIEGSFTDITEQANQVDFETAKQEVASKVEAIDTTEKIEEPKTIDDIKTSKEPDQAPKPVEQAPKKTSSTVPF